MAVELSTAYSITHQAAKLERAAYARTLTNNPSPAVEAVLDSEIGATVALLGGEVVPSTSAVVESGVTYQMLVSRDGGEAENYSVVFTIVDGAIISATSDIGG